MKLAFLFPGQGSQAVGMLDSLAGVPVVADLIQQADDALGERLSQLIAQGPAESLGLTVNTQPAMLLAGIGERSPIWFIRWLSGRGGAPMPAIGAIAGFEPPPVSMMSPRWGMFMASPTMERISFHLTFGIAIAA